MRCSGDSCRLLLLLSWWYWRRPAALSARLRRPSLPRGSQSGGAQPPPSKGLRAKATGRLAKTEKIDAHVLARFAKAVRPEPRALPEEEVSLLREILDRRRQLISMLVAENNRLSATVSDPLKKRIRRHTRWQEKELSRTERELEEA